MKKTRIIKIVKCNQSRIARRHSLFSTHSILSSELSSDEKLKEADLRLFFLCFRFFLLFPRFFDFLFLFFFWDFLGLQDELLEEGEETRTLQVAVGLVSMENEFRDETVEDEDLRLWINGGTGGGGFSSSLNPSWPHLPSGTPLARTTWRQNSKAVVGAAAEAVIWSDSSNLRLRSKRHSRIAESPRDRFGVWDRDREDPCLRRLALSCLSFLYSLQQRSSSRI